MARLSAHSLFHAFAPLQDSLIQGRWLWRLLLVGGLLAGVLIPSPGAVYAQGECTGPFLSVSRPLTELGPDEYVRRIGVETPVATGFQGGLYPGGVNQRPPAHEAAGLAVAAQIVPRNADGQPDPAGKIGLISVGMSNTSSEFNTWMAMAHRDPAVNRALVPVNGAQGGRTADFWTDPYAATWQELEQRVARAGLTNQQVQVAWIKQTLTRGGEFPAKAQELERALAAIARNLTLHFPNLRIAYLSSRTRSYTYERGLSPEPVAFETGFAVKWLIEKQIAGDPTLNFDPAQGAVQAPYLSWGPYLWADGENPRADGLTWTQADLAQDCTHPSPSGNQKVARLLMDFFKTDTTATAWFLAPAAATPAGLPMATPRSVSPLRVTSIPQGPGAPAVPGNAAPGPTPSPAGCAGGSACTPESPPAEASPGAAPALPTPTSTATPPAIATTIATLTPVPPWPGSRERYRLALYLTVGAGLALLLVGTGWISLRRHRGR
ncbi:hypothetical protein FKZ61_011805 [Litorilinea aerophila]|uniref:Uncharacterized protein n=1 Tax=Litorilinea aerophila TaxID=1204385 RepID=A0A540VFF7_9CHLR|nr:hypothetical protein [Litorilinea aerophila]MCC9076793.1 hypothetical protein [Litorilinea aerophila]